MEFSAGTVSLIKFATETARSLLSYSDEDEHRLGKSIERHMRFIQNWTSQTKFMDFVGGQIETDRSTVPLELSQTPRRFRVDPSTQSDLDLKSPIIPEQSSVRDVNILEENYSVLLLGDPGSGKTTTIKRLSRALLFPELYGLNIDTLSVSFPLLIPAREMTSVTLSEEVVRVLDIPVEITKETVKNPRTDEVSEVTIKRVNGQLLESFVVDLLESLKVCLFVDGVDEVHSSLRSNIQRELSSMALHLDQARVFATIRSGYIDAHWDGFAILELCPLEVADVQSIASRNLENPDEFLTEVQSKPYADLLRRPLFLIYLILLFEDSRKLPAEPVFLYERIVDLMLEKWDKKRRIERQTSYTDFLKEEKKRFLSALAYFLFYESSSPGATFDRDNFRNFFKSVCKRFRIPADQGDQVATEIESHTGIVVQVSQDENEFSHLSIQEYLAACYINSLPDLGQTRKYLVGNQSPLAIAVALSNNPDIFLHKLLNIYSKNYSLGIKNNLEIGAFFGRLAQEQPAFIGGYHFGICLIYLAKVLPDEATLLDRHSSFFSNESSVESVRSVLSNYRIASISDDGRFTEFSMFEPTDVDNDYKSVLFETDFCSRGDRLKIDQSFFEWFRSDEYRQ